MKFLPRPSLYTRRIPRLNSVPRSSEIEQNFTKLNENLLVNKSKRSLNTKKK